MSADVISGIGGAVDSANCSRLWKIARIIEPAFAVCSASDGAVIRARGISDFRGVYLGYGHTPPVLPGETFQFTGSTRDGKGATTAANGAIVEQVDIDWDIEGAKFIEYACHFAAATGALTLGTASATDASTPSPSESRSCEINLAGCTELRKMKLTLLAKNPPYVTGSTAGRRERVAGIKDGRFSCKIYTDDASFPAENAIEEVTFGVGGGLSWTMKWAIITLTAPLLPLGGGLFEADLAGQFTGYYGAAKGNITSPAGAAWWN